MFLEHLYSFILICGKSPEDHKAVSVTSWKATPLKFILILSTLPPKSLMKGLLFREYYSQSAIWTYVEKEIDEKVPHIVC